MTTKGKSQYEIWQMAIRLIVEQMKTTPIKYEEQHKLEVSE